MKNNKLKPITFHSSFEEMKLFGQMHSIEPDGIGRLAQMQRLNRKVFGENYGNKVSKKVEVFSADPGEDV